MGSGCNGGSYHEGMKILGIVSELLKVPLPRAVSTGANGTPAKAVDLVLVRVKTDTLTGLGFTYSFGQGRGLKTIIDDTIAPLVLGEDAGRIEWLFLKAAHEIEGFTGLAARAYAAIDFALWDLKGQHANLSVCSLLGGYRTKLKAVVTDTATPALGVKAAAKETRALLDLGAAGVQIEVGTVDPDADVERLKQLLEALPSGPWMEVNAAGRYDAASALWMGRAFEQEFAIDSFLDPLADAEGLPQLTQRLEMSVGAGMHFDRVADFTRAMNIPGLSTLRVDLLKLGGLTPARKIAHAAELKGLAVTPVRLPEVGCHLTGSIVYGRMCEYVDWFAELLGGPRFDNGQLMVPDAPGLGLKVNETLIQKFAV